MGTAHCADRLVRVSPAWSSSRGRRGSRRRRRESSNEARKELLPSFLPLLTGPSTRLLELKAALGSLLELNANSSVYSFLRQNYQVSSHVAEVRSASLFPPFLFFVLPRKSRTQSAPSLTFLPPSSGTLSATYPSWEWPSLVSTRLSITVCPPGSLQATREWVSSV